MTASRSGPLSGTTILEISHMLAGPYCGMLLADLGANVIKIEAPNGGDIARTIGPHVVGVHNTYFASLNRNKKSVVLDLVSSDGRAALEALVQKAHGLITNLRPSAIKKLGLTYDALANANPRIACLALTGYGLNGPFADQPAYDYVIQAIAGVMALTGDPQGPPVKTGYSVVDNSAGIMGALALVAMMHEGHGGQLDVSLYDAMLSQMNYLASAYLNGGERPQRQAGGAHPYIVPAQIFETAEGHLALFVSHDEFWHKFATKIGPPHWLTDSRFSTMKGRAENRALVIGEVASLIRTNSTKFWVNELAPLGIVVAGVQTLDQALDSDLTAAREMVVNIPTPDGVVLRLVGSPIKFDKYTANYQPPPKLGEHTSAVLEGTGYSGFDSANAAEPEHRSGSRRAFARSISHIADASVAEILASAPGEQESHVPVWRIGITGAPGSGKSSLIARLAKARVERLKLNTESDCGRVGKIAVLAIDPSSPVNRGAILGDRVRMDAIVADPQIFVRSLASKGGQDGLAHNITEMLALADAYGFREIILETVGIGQAEHSVRSLVDTLVLVLQPDSGDSIQFMKSGVMEIADILVISKADLPGAKRTSAEIRSVVKLADNRQDGWTRPIIAISREDETGIAELDSAIEQHKSHVKSCGSIPATSLTRRRHRLRSLVQRRIDEVLDGQSELLASPNIGVQYKKLLTMLLDENANNR